MSDTDSDVDVEMTPEPDPNAVPIMLNGREIVARKGESIIAAADRHGEYIPQVLLPPADEFRSACAASAWSRSIPAVARCCSRVA